MPTVTVLYFAGLQERLGLTEEQVDLPAISDDRAVLDLLAARHPQAAALFAPCRLAVDQAFVRGPVTIGPTSEIAVIPPVSGG